MVEGAVSLLGSVRLIQKEAQSHLGLTLDLTVFHRMSDLSKLFTAECTPGSRPPKSTIGLQVVVN